MRGNDACGLIGVKPTSLHCHGAIHAFRPAQVELARAHYAADTARASAASTTRDAAAGRAVPRSRS